MAYESSVPMSMPDSMPTGAVTAQETYGLSPKGWRDYLLDQIDAHDKEFRDANTRSTRIVKRYRDERMDGQSVDRRYNVLWANTQTLLPAITGKGAPVPVSKRRFMDADPAGRVASTVIERTLRYQFDCHGGTGRALKSAGWDWLVPGRGTVWIRYEEGNGRPPGLPKHDKGTGFGKPGKGQGSAAQMLTQTVVEDQPAYAVERVALDYVYWEDFGFSNARGWDEVSLVWRRVYLTREELRKRFSEEVAKELPCSIQGSAVTRDATSDNDTPKHGVFNKAAVYEVWDKVKRTVTWVSRDHDDPLDIVADPLKLPGFFPCPRPLLANCTTGNLLPVPFYAQYQDQALQLDILSERMHMLTKACKLVGVYDASQEGVQRMMNEAVENQLIPVDTWAAFAEKGGVKGVMDWLPIEQVVNTLKVLGERFEQLKNQVYEITGIGEIMRGASSHGGTAAEAKMQEQYISVRLDDLRQEYARFCDDAVEMMGHVICTLFRDESLIAQSGIMQTWDGQQVLQGAMPPPPMPTSPPPAAAQGMPMGPPMGPPAMAPPPAPPLSGTPAMPPPGAAPFPPPPGMGPPPGPPPGMGPPPGGNVIPMPGMQGPPPPSPVPVLMEALQLIRQTPMTDFRVRVDVESFIDDEVAMEREQRIAFLTALTQFMQQALPAVQQNAALGPLMNALMLFNVRTFKAGREMEGQIEQALAQLAAAPQPPQKPDPKAQAAMMKVQADIQKMQADAQISGQEAQAKLQMLQQENAMKLQMMQQEGNLKMEQMRMEFEFKMQALQTETAAKAEKMQIESQIKQQAAMQQMETDAMTAVAGEQREAASNEITQERAQEQHELDLRLREEDAEFDRAQAAKAPKK